MITKFLRSLFILPLLMVFGMVGASADTSATGNNMTITVPSSATLTARVALAVSIQVQCVAEDSQYTNFFYPVTVFFNTGTTTVLQASGTTVNRARADFGPITCDGTTHTYTAYLAAGTAPFHPGPAAIFASATWFEQFGGCLISDPTNCGFFEFTNSASVQGPITLSP